MELEIDGRVSERVYVSGDEYVSRLRAMRRLGMISGGLWAVFITKAATFRRFKSVLTVVQHQALDKLIDKTIIKLYGTGYAVNY